jgi:outer membrane biosynthesis protein TonB
VYDAVTTVAVYLCSEGDDLKRPMDLVSALLRYQHSKDFVATVLRWMRVYSKSAVLIPNAKGNLSTPKPTGNADRKVDPRQVPDVPDDPKQPAQKPTTRPTGKPSIPDPIDTPTGHPPTHPPTDRPTKPPTDTPTPTDPPTDTPTPTPSDSPTPTPSDTPSGSPCAGDANPTPCTQGSGSHG